MLFCTYFLNHYILGGAWFPEVDQKFFMGVSGSLWGGSSWTPPFGTWTLKKSFSQSVFSIGPGVYAQHNLRIADYAMGDIVTIYELPLLKSIISSSKDQLLLEKLENNKWNDIKFEYYKQFLLFDVKICMKTLCQR